MSRPSVVTIEALTPLLAEGKTASEIAQILGVQSPAVTRACHRLGITRPGKGRPRKDPAPQEKTTSTAAKIDADPRKAALIATGGRYADLRAWAKEYGTTETKALQEWLKLRRPVRKGGTA